MRQSKTRMATELDALKSYPQKNYKLLKGF